MSQSLTEGVAHLVRSAREDAGRYRRIERITWPGGARIAVNFTADFDAMLLRRLNNEPAEQLAKDGIEAEVIDLRTLRPLDMATVIDSVKRTNRIVTVEDAIVRGRYRWRLLVRAPREIDIQAPRLSQRARCAAARP